MSEFLRKGVEAGCPNISEMFFLTFTLCSMATQSVERLGMGGSSVRNGDENVAATNGASEMGTRTQEFGGVKEFCLTYQQ